MAENRAWESVLARVESDLSAGRLRVGDRLPPERALATDLGVGRSSVREALRVLEVMGLIRTATGSGPGAGAVVVSRPSGGMESLIRLQVAGRGFDVEHVVRTRIVLESEVVRHLAASGISRHEPGALLDTMDSTPDRAQFLALDAAFHFSLAEQSGNTVVAAVMAGLRGSIEGYVQDGAARIDDWAAMSTRLQVEHRAILAAVVAGDGPAAEQLIHDHIEGYYARTNLITLPKG